MKKYGWPAILTALILAFGSIGFVHAEIIPPCEPGQQIGYPAVVLCEKLTLREKPSSSSGAVRTLNYGDLPIKPVHQRTLPLSVRDRRRRRRQEGQTVVVQQAVQHDPQRVDVHRRAVLLVTPELLGFFTFHVDEQTERHGSHDTNQPVNRV